MKGLPPAVSTVTAVLPYGAERVWSVVTNMKDTAWRSDICRVEVLAQDRFVEHARSGVATTFTVTVWQAPHSWAFDMENANMHGQWKGQFETLDNGCRLTFTETVTAKRWWMRPFVPMYLKRQHRRYLNDLRRKLAGEA